MWSDERPLRGRRTPARRPVVAGLLGAAVLLAACSSRGSGGGDGDAAEAPATEQVVAVGEAVEVGDATATVTAVEAVEATAVVYVADGDRVAVEVSVCGRADDVAGLWTLHVGDDVLEPVPLPPGALPEENQPTFDFTAGPGPDGCRTGWVAWDVPAGGDGVVVWEGDPEAGWPTT